MAEQPIHRGSEVMDIAAAEIRSRLDEMARNRDLLALDIRTLLDARHYIGHLVERIEELENPIGPPCDEAKETA